MKLNPYILIGVILAAIFLSLKTNEISSMPSTLNDKDLDQKNIGFNTVGEAEKSSGITPEYFIKFFAENGFKVLPVFEGTTSDIYTGKMFVGDTNIEFIIDVYYERSSKEVLLIEGIIDGSYYVNSDHEIEVIKQMDKIAEKFFTSLAKIPYHSSNPLEAENWIKKNIIESYSDSPKEKTSQEFGLATMNVYGSPLMRILEIDFGF